MRLEMKPTICAPQRGMEERMFVAVEINLALWGLIICSVVQVAGWLQSAF